MDMLVRGPINGGNMIIAVDWGDKQQNKQNSKRACIIGDRFLMCDIFRVV